MRVTSDRFQTRPSMLFLQPADVYRNRDAARFDAAMIGSDRGMFRRGLCQRVVEENIDIGVQRARAPTVASSTQRLELIRGKPARPNSNVNPVSNAIPLAPYGKGLF